MKFSAQDPIDYASNCLSPRNIRGAYLDGATAIASGITFSTLVTEQEYLNTAELDAALALQLDAYQKQLAAQAIYFSTITGDFVKLAANAGNFSTLMTAFSGEIPKTLPGAETDAAKRDEAASMLDALVDEAGNILLSLSTIDTHLTALEGNLSRNNAAYDTTIAAAVTQLGARAAAAQTEIDRLTKAVSERVSDIVKGANEEGEAVADLFIGILTQFTKSGAAPNAPTPDPKKPDAKPEAAAPAPKVESPKVEPAKPAPAAPAAAAAVSPPGAPKLEASKPDATAPKTDGSKPDPAKPATPSATTPAKPKEETPNAEFVLKAVKASFNGVAKYSSAIRNLELDNAALAQAYMELAALSPQVAVAKSAQAQKNLFTASVTQARTALTTLRSEWTAVRKNLGEAAKGAAALDSAPEAKALGRLAASAARMWTGVGDEIGAIKRALTGSGGLPGV